MNQLPHLQLRLLLISLKQLEAVGHSRHLEAVLAAEGDDDGVLPQLQLDLPD